MIVQNLASQAVQVAPSAPAAQPAPKASGFVADVAKASPVLGNAVESTSNTARQVSPEALQNAVSVINQVMRQSNNSLQFSVDTDSNTPVVRLVDSKTGELIRQIPSEETLAISRSIDAVLEQQGLPCIPGLLCKQVA